MSWSKYSREPHPLIGKLLTGAFITKDKQYLRFDVDGQEPTIAFADGDCCSRTWIEGVEGAQFLVGGTITAIEDIDMPEQPYDEHEHESLKFYGLRITTDKGVCIVDYRNSSNGYYGGSLEWGPDSFYGGVWGQNVSKNPNTWEPLSAHEQA